MSIESSSEWESMVVPHQALWLCTNALVNMYSAFIPDGSGGYERVGNLADVRGFVEGVAALAYFWFVKKASSERVNAEHKWPSRIANDLNAILQTLPIGSFNGNSLDIATEWTGSAPAEVLAKTEAALNQALREVHLARNPLAGDKTQLAASWVSVMMANAVKNTRDEYKKRSIYRWAEQNVMWAWGANLKSFVADVYDPAVKNRSHRRAFAALWQGVGDDGDTMNASFESATRAALVYCELGDDCRYSHDAMLKNQSALLGLALAHPRVWSLFYSKEGSPDEQQLLKRASDRVEAMPLDAQNLSLQSMEGVSAAYLGFKWNPSWPPVDDVNLLRSPLLPYLSDLYTNFDTSFDLKKPAIEGELDVAYFQITEMHKQIRRRDEEIKGFKATTLGVRQILERLAGLATAVVVGTGRVEREGK